MTNAVICKEITKNYGDEERSVAALRGITFEVRDKELLMLVGPSGCGKTTLLSIISGILTPTGGSCHIFGEELEAMSDETKTRFRAENIGFVFQSLNLIPSLSAVENVAFPLMIGGANREEALAKAEEMLCSLSLQERLHALPTHLSGGEQQRVAICRGCIHEPKLIVCDEPTSALDEETGKTVLEMFKNLTRALKSTLIIVTHDRRIFPFADRILEMNDGKITGAKRNHT